MLTDILYVCVFGVTKAGSKRAREEEEEEQQEEEEESRPESSHTSPTTKKLRLKPSIALEVNKITQRGKSTNCILKGFFIHGFQFSNILKDA